MVSDRRTVCGSLADRCKLYVQHCCAALLSHTMRSMLLHTMLTKQAYPLSPRFRMSHVAVHDDTPCCFERRDCPMSEHTTPLLQQHIPCASISLEVHFRVDMIPASQPPPVLLRKVASRVHARGRPGHGPALCSPCFMYRSQPRTGQWPRLA